MLVDELKAMSCSRELVPPQSPARICCVGCQSCWLLSGWMSSGWMSVMLDVSHVGCDIGMDIGMIL